MLFFDHDTKVKTYSSTSRAGKHVLKVELEYGDAISMAYDMERLDAALAEQKKTAKPARNTRSTKPKKVAHQKPLALPAPGDEE